MWDYWRDKYGIRGAIDQYPKAKIDPIISVAIADYDRAAASLDALMDKFDQKDRAEKEAAGEI